ncbi:MAG: hypothetical protein H0V51_04565 [Chloroflexi bacterium]|nr:hypothetical protein [Chloroflexota bacterium]
MSQIVAILLLHGEGWDELVMVAVGLILAYGVVSLTGRQPPTDAEDDENATSLDRAPTGHAAQAGVEVENQRAEER